MGQCEAYGKRKFNVAVYGLFICFIKFIECGCEVSGCEVLLQEFDSRFNANAVMNLKYDGNTYCKSMAGQIALSCLVTGIRIDGLVCISR